MKLLERLRALSPSREQIHNNRWLRWLGPSLGHPKLWHWSRRGVAMGVALGVFFGLLIPIAQIPMSVGAAIVLRANVPAAAASTLITNPLTFGPIYFAAYHLGAWITGEQVPTKLEVFDVATLDEVEAAAENASLWQRIQAVGKPLLVGLSITATLMGLLTYGLITLIWRLRALAKRRQRRRP